MLLNGTGSLHFGWFNSEDYLSYDGVEATIHPPHEDEKVELGDCAWALHTRTRSSASPADRKQQNDVIRLARSKFGGNFYNDWFGRNRYIKVEDDYRDAPSRGIFLVYEYVTNNIRAVQFALPEPNENFEKLIGTNLEPLSEIDPTRVLYNAIIPFVVAAIEHFFSCCFKIRILQYDPKAQERLKRQSRKIDMSDVLLVQSRKKTVEDIVVGWYSFQNINSIHIAFKEWFDIDIWKILRRYRYLENSSSKEKSRKEAENIRDSTTATHRHQTRCSSSVFGRSKTSEGGSSRNAGLSFVCN